ncbi:MAG: hypothetical protein K2L13_04320, partial [Opitutales bacterium]|nr:hypothetical protein [Opitutales bacterium]
MSKAIAGSSTENALFLSEISYYDRNGFCSAICTVNQDFSSLSNRENSTYFSKENSFLDSYVRCIEDATKLQQSISAFRNKIDQISINNCEKNLDTRCLEQVREPSSDTATPNSDELIKELVETLKTIEDQFRKIVSPGKIQDSLDLNRLKSFQSGQETYVKKLKEWETARNITNTLNVIKSEKLEEYVDKEIAIRIQNQGNIEALNTILASTLNVDNPPPNSVPDVVPQGVQFVTIPQDFVENVKLVLGAFSTAFQKLVASAKKTQNCLTDDLQKILIQIVQDTIK